MKAKKWIVTAVDTSETADGKPRVLKVCNSKEAAMEYVQKDMECFEEQVSYLYLSVDHYGMSIHSVDFSFGCEWNIEEVDIEV